MKRLQILENAVNRATARESVRVSKAKEKLFAEYKKLFQKSKELAKDFKSLEDSREFGQDACGIYSWTRLTYTVPDNEYAREAFDAYVTDCGYMYDDEYDALKNYQGESIVIGDNGDVYVGDAGNSKQIISYSEYEEDTDKRNKLIEAWMDKNGFYPNVFRETANGNIFLVNTQGGSK